MTISHTINFNLKYNSTDVISEPIKKEYFTKYVIYKRMKRY